MWKTTVVAYSLVNNKLIFLDVLAINTRGGNKRAYSISLRGGYELLDFNFGYGTEVYFSCSLQWQNQFYVFGGKNEKKQVSVVNGNRLERKGTLDFDFSEGGCTVLNQSIIVLCFGDPNNRKLCRQLHSNNPVGSFTKLPESNHGHRATRIASFDGKNYSSFQQIACNFFFVFRGK